MTLFGVIAHGERARAALRNRNIPSIAQGLASDEQAWWIDQEGRAALLDAVVVRTKVGARVISVDSSSLVSGGLASLFSKSRATSRLQSRNVVTSISRHWSGDPAALAGIAGDFALACWDPIRGRLILARDHFGQKQLFIRHTEGLSLFCSNLGFMLEDPTWQPDMDFESAVRYLTRGLPLTGRTLAKGIDSIPAAHALVWEPPKRPMVQRYWTPLGPQGLGTTRKEILKETTAALKRAIISRLAPRGNALLLSGGVDSSYIAAIAVTSISPKQLGTYTIEYEPSYDRNEGEYASAVTKRIGARHALVSLTPERAYSLLQDTLAAPLPCSAWATITHKALLLEIAERGEKRLLSGLGADEIFGGYDRFLDYYFRQRRFARLGKWSGQVDWFDALLDSPADAAHCLFPGIASFFNTRRLRKFLCQPFPRIELDGFDREFYRECRRLKPTTHLFEMMVAHECQHRIPDLLMSSFEPVAQGTGVSTSYPFLDPALVNWAAFLGPADRYWHENGAWWAKKMYRQIAGKVLPHSIVMRRRATYDSPLAEWLTETHFRRGVLDRFASSSFWNVGFLRRTLKTDLLKKVRNLPDSLRFDRGWPEEFWVVLTLACWFDRYIARIR